MAGRNVSSNWCWCAAIWTEWFDTTLLAPVPHRQVVLTIPKRLRAYCLYRRRLLGEIARVAARIVTVAMRALTGERDLAVGTESPVNSGRFRPGLCHPARAVPRGMREQAALTAADGPSAIVPAPRLVPTEATRRWAALLQQTFEVGPLARPSVDAPTTA